MKSPFVWETVSQHAPECVIYSLKIRLLFKTITNCILLTLAIVSSMHESEMTVLSGIASTIVTVRLIFA